MLDVNGEPGTAPIVLDATVGQPVVLDASRSRDPDGEKLEYRWFLWVSMASGHSYWRTFEHAFLQLRS
jgi:hypothetical protein